MPMRPAYRGWPLVETRCVEQCGSEHDGEEDAGAAAHALSDTKVFDNLTDSISNATFSHEFGHAHTPGCRAR